MEILRAGAEESSVSIHMTRSSTQQNPYPSCMPSSCLGTGMARASTARTEKQPRHTNTLALTISRDLELPVARDSQVRV